MDVEDAHNSELEKIISVVSMPTVPQVCQSAKRPAPSTLRLNNRVSPALQRVPLDYLVKETGIERPLLEEILVDALATGDIRGKLDHTTGTLAVLDFKSSVPRRDELPGIIDDIQLL